MYTRGLTHIFPSYLSTPNLASFSLCQHDIGLYWEALCEQTYMLHIPLMLNLRYVYVHLSKRHCYCLSSLISFMRLLMGCLVSCPSFSSVTIESVLSHHLHSIDQLHFSFRALCNLLSIPHLARSKKKDIALSQRHGSKTFDPRERSCLCNWRMDHYQQPWNTHLPRPAARCSPSSPQSGWC